jgi:Ca-activated chloride channel family protein
MINNAILKEITISGNMIGGIFQNEIEQVYINNGEGNVELIYTFPMPENASISGFSAVTGSGRYIGVVRETETALKEYQQALADGDSAYMLESHRDNIFQTSLG